MREEVGRQSAGVVPVLAPAEEALGVEWAGRRRTEEPIPVEVGGLAPALDRVVPVPAARVAHEAGLAEDQPPQSARLDDLQHAVVGLVRGRLGADLDHATGTLSGAVEIARLVPVAAHRLLAVDILTGFQGVDTHAGMPVVRCGDPDAVDVVPGEQIAIVEVGSGAAGDVTGAFPPRSVDVANGSDLDRRVVDQIAKVVGSLVADADHADGDPVVGRDP